MKIHIYKIRAEYVGDAPSGEYYLASNARKDKISKSIGNCSSVKSVSVKKVGKLEMKLGDLSVPQLNFELKIFK